MNKKHFKSLCYFLTLIFLMLTVSTVCATDINENTDVNVISEQTTTQPVVATETNDYTDNIINNEKTVKDIDKYNANETKSEKSESGTYKVAALRTNLTVGSSSTVYVGDKMSIYGKLSQNGTDLANQKISVSVDGETYNLTTSQYGNYKFQITPTSAGLKMIVATYNGTETYTPDIAMSLFLVSKKITNLTVGSTESVKFGQPISIYGKLSQNGKNLANQTISIYVNTDEYNVTTSAYGNYKLQITPDTPGLKVILANYAGTDVYTMAVASSTSDIILNETELTVGSSKTVYVGDEMSIYGKLTDNNGKGMANQNVYLLVDGEEYSVTTSQYGNYKFQITPKTAGLKVILASYPGKGYYTPSVASSSFSAIKKISNLTVGSAKNITLGNTISIYGKLSQNGKNLAYQNITVFVDGEEYNLTTTQYGNYKFQITPKTAGAKKILATYDGSDEYTAGAASSSFTVNRITSNLTVGSRKSVNIQEPMSIYGKLSQNGKDIANQKIIVTVDGQIHIVTTSKYGNYKFQITPTSTGLKTINAYYAGSTEFTGATVTETFVVYKKTADLTVGSRANVNVGEEMSVYGKLSQNGKNIENENVTVTVDGQTYTVTTTAYGNYNFKIVPQTAGEKVITATYDGSEIYTEATAKSTFLANQITSSITVGSSANVKVGDQMSIYGKLTDKNGNNLAYQKITVKVDGESYDVTTNQYGNYNFKIIPTTAGTKTIIANFAGTNVYTSSIATSKFTAN